MDRRTRYDGTERECTRVADPGRERSVSARDLNAYLDAELSAAQQRTLALRLVTDADARTRIAELAEVRRLVRLAYETTGTD
jgi:anti-sigma factor RsiW